MPSPSRRAFLTGHRPPTDPWTALCQRLDRLVTGSIYKLDAVNGHGQARLLAHALTDVHHARAVCADEGVQLAFGGGPAPLVDVSRPVLWVTPGSGLARCERLEPQGSRWFVQPGCTVAALQAAGFNGLQGVASDTTVADWLLSAPGARSQVPGVLGVSGLVYASVLLADGTSAGLGPFGERNTKPLQGWSLQQLVSSLFQLIWSPEAQTCRAQTCWPARYRLDALLPEPPEGINLSRLLLGSQGALGWLEWVVLDDAMVSQPAKVSTSLSVDSDPTVSVAARQLDRQIKQLFDPDGLFFEPDLF